MRVGLGFDLHRLVPGRPFIIGGVRIDCEFGPQGHSDGDALLHAIADALLGAAALGDIGQWFPADDPAYAGADSAGLLAKIGLAVAEKGLAIENIDSVIICEAPKLSPHYLKMRRRIADVLGLALDQVSVKATTNEGLGEIGRGEAVAAKAVVLLKNGSGSMS